MDQPCITVDGITYSTKQVQARLRWLRHLAKNVFAVGIQWIHLHHLKMERELPDVRLVELQEPIVDERETKENSL